MKGKKIWIFVVLALLAAALFVRLGFWQLHRRAERRARNALITARLDSAEIDVRRLPSDTTLARFRRVRVTGTPDYEHELLFAARTRRGSPGVNILTPVKLAGSDTAVMLNRGWVYAADGATVDLSKWHERDSSFTGYVEELPSTGGATYTGKPRIIAHMSVDVIRKAVPYPVMPIYVMVLGDSAVAADRVARLSVPPLDDGPHMGYALQWFAFAVIAVAGAGFVVKQTREQNAS